MTTIHFSDTIESHERKLHLQSQAAANSRQMTLTLFDSGQVLHQRIVPLEGGSAATTENVRSIHAEWVMSLSLMSGIFSRLDTIDHPQSLEFLGHQFMRWQMFKESFQIFNRVISSTPELGQPYIYLSEMYRVQGKLEKAAEILLKGVEKAPGNRDLWHALGVIYLDQDQFSEALKAFRKSLEKNDRFDSHIYTAVCLLEAEGESGGDIPAGSSGTKNDVEKHIQAACQSAPIASKKRLEEILKEYRTGKTGTAMQLRKWIQSHNTGDLDFLEIFYLAYIYSDWGRHPRWIQKTVKRMEHLEETGTTLPDLNRHLGIGYILLCRGLFDKALESLKKASQKDPHSQQIRKAMRLVENEEKGLSTMIKALLS